MAKLKLPEMEILDDEPFANDKLDRREPIETLTNLIDNIDSPFILSVDAPWGSGKTTFLKMWEKHLQKMGYIVVNFNAWETDFSNDPFLALSSEIATQLAAKDGAHSISDHIDALKDFAKEVAFRRVPNVLSTIAALGTAAAGAPAVSLLTGDLVRVAAERLLQSHQETQDSIHAFQTKLAALAEVVSGIQNGRPIIVMIDELDRCRPTYAIELLENAKHIFSVKNIVFALSMNRSQLAESVKAIYGQGFEAGLYLERFFDISFNLPHLDRAKFIHHAIEATPIHEELQAPNLKWAFAQLLNDSNLNLRDISKVVHHLNIVAASQGTKVMFQNEVAALLLLFRAINPNWYRRFTLGNVTEDQILNSLVAGMHYEEPNNGLEQIAYEAVLRAVRLEILERRSEIDNVLDSVMRDRGISDLRQFRYELDRCFEAMTGSFTNHHMDLKGLLRRIELLTADTIRN